MDEIPRARRADPEPDHAPPPRRYRREFDDRPRPRDDDRRRPPSPKGGGWMVVGIVAAVVILLLAVSGVIIAAVMLQKPPTKPTVKPVYPVYPSGPNPFNMSEVAGEDDAEVRALVAQLGKAVADRGRAVEDLFDVTELMTLRADGADEEWASGPHGTRAVAGDVIRARRPGWEKWDWAKADVRRVARRTDGRAGLEIIVWHPTKAGGREKVRWFARLTSDSGWMLTGWENLRTGITANDLALAAAYARSGTASIRAARQWRFSQLEQFDKQVAAKKWEEAGKTLADLKGVNWDSRLRYAVELAEARLTATEPGFDDDEREYDLVAEIAEELVKDHPNRLAAYPLLAEACVALEKHPQAIKACDSYLTAAGDDPDVLALRGVARLALVETDDAVADFTRALALDPHQPRALNWKRQTADAAGKRKLADLLATAPNPEALFDALTDGAETDADWEAVVAFGEAYRRLRPKDCRWADRMAVAHARSKRPADAGQLLAEALPAFPPAERKKVVERFVWAMTDTEQADAAYAQVPDADAPAAFRRLADHHYVGFDPLDEFGKVRKADAVAALKGLLAEHAKKHPADPYLAVIDGRVKNAAGEHAKAAEVLAAAIGKLTHTGDWEKDFESGYASLKGELLTARYKSGRGVDAYRELEPPAEVFRDLAWRYTRDNDHAGLGALLDARQPVEKDARDTPFWRGEADRMADRPADAAKHYRRYLAAEPTDEYDPHRDVAHTNLLRSLMKAGDAATALKELQTGTHPALKAAVLVAAGKRADAEMYLREIVREDEGWLRFLYTDEDLGPLLKSDPAFAKFRRDFPPPTDKLAPPG